MNARSGVYKSGPASWIPKMFRPYIFGTQALPMPSPIATIEPTPAALVAKAATNLLADQSYAEMLQARQRELDLISQGSRITRYGIYGVIGFAVLVLMWVLLVRVCTSDEKSEDDD